MHYIDVVLPVFASFCVKGLSRVQDGVLICEVDLNLIQQIKDKWCFQVRFSIQRTFGVS